MSTPAFIDPDSSTQADRAQSSRVPVPLPEDPYEAIRQAYLDGTNTEFEHFEDPVETETPDSPLTIAPPTSLPEGTPPTLVPILYRTARTAVRVPPAMSSGLSVSMTEVAAMSESAFRKRFRSSYESLLSLSPPDLPSRKRYRDTSELVKDSEEDDDEEDEEIEESLDSDSVSKDVEDKGPTAKDEDPAAGDEGLAAGPRTPSDGLGLEEEDEVVPAGQQQAAPVIGTAGSGSALESERPKRVSASRHPTLTTWIDPKDGMVYIDVPAYQPPAPPVQTPLSPEWKSGSLPISPSPSIVPSPVSLPMIPLTVPSPVATPATAETEGFLTELGAQVEMQGGLICNHAVRLGELSPALFERVRAGEGRSDIWSDMETSVGPRVIGRRARLELAEVVDSMRRGHEPRGDT
ncbi:hypothetical protein Tco_0592708 [Tanacetum coccineum]